MEPRPRSREYDHFGPRQWNVRSSIACGILGPRQWNPRSRKYMRLCSLPGPRQWNPCSRYNDNYDHFGPRQWNLRSSITWHFGATSMEPTFKRMIVIIIWGHVNGTHVPENHDLGPRQWATSAPKKDYDFNVQTRWRCSTFYVQWNPGSAVQHLRMEMAHVNENKHISP